MRLVDDEGKDVAAGEVGEIAIRGENVMKGYWNRPEDTAKAIPDGWFRTGDLARQDEDGYYFIVDRKKEMIIRGGYNVYPREIEEALYEHPAVAEAACIGIAHPDLGEEVAAAVALKPGAIGRGRRAARLRQGAGRRLQVPAAPLAGRRAAQGPDRQDPAPVRRGARGGGRHDERTRPAVAAGLRRRRARGHARAPRASCARRASPSAPPWSAARDPRPPTRSAALTARAWHLVNLPAGSDVSRLRAQIGALDREVRRLTLRLENERRPDRPDRTPTDPTTTEDPHAERAQPADGPRPRPARRRAQRPAGT